MKNLKKVLSLILVLTLILPNMVFADGLNNESNLKSLEDKIRFIQETVRGEKVLEDLVPDFNDDDIVRIIVELEEKPVIVYANASGQKYEEMSYSQRSAIESELYAAQDAVKNSISARNIDMIFGKSYTSVFNGFSGEVKFEDIQLIETIKGVKKVYISNEYERPVIEPNMSSSHDMIGSKDVWAEGIGYKGEGMVVAIIDTGIDPAHKDFVLSEGTIPSLTEALVNQKITEVSLQGKYFTEKVPYGYNYYDLNQEILDLGPDASEHGMHVAGTVTANGDIKGIAPESQVLAMKVFSNDPIYSTTFDDIYLAAIEDAIKLEADVLNMSLGASASFYVADSAVDTAITNATNNGIVCSISAGNSGYAQYGWKDTNYGYPLKEDPDYGVVGSPSLSKDSISVASIENINMVVENYLEYIIPGVAEVLPSGSIIIEDKAYELSKLSTDIEAKKHLLKAYKLDPKPIYIKYSATTIRNLDKKAMTSEELPETVEYIYTDENGIRQSRIYAVLPGGTTGDGEIVQAPMTLAGPYVLPEVFKEEVEFVDCGNGAPEVFTDKDMNGKIALIIRGGISFVEKIENAQNAGAAGVIVYNHADGGDELINMMYPDNGTIPAGFIGYSYGSKLVELKNKSIKFKSGALSIPNTKGGQMSDFSSWGTTPTLELKPEITAPGGMIYSTLQNNRYGTMSGTSMAAPHLSGGAALVMQYIKDKNLATGLDAETKLAKVLLMNTAGIVMEDLGKGEFTPYSPRKQGAGLMNLKAAVTTPVRVVNANNGEAKVELKDFQSKSFTMELVAINHTAEDVMYNISTDVLTDFVYPGLGINLLSSINVNANVTVTDDGKITVPANGEKAFTVTVDISEDTEIYRNMFVEGYVKLTEATDTHPELSVPFVGFYGDWDEPRILDAMLHETEDKSYYERSQMLKLDGDKLYFFGDKIAFSPVDSDESFNVLPLLSFMRNAEEIQYNILNEEGIKIRTILQESFVRKTIIDGGRYNPYSYVPARAWDGKAKGKIVEDGLYKYQIRAKVQNGEWQEKVVPVYVDTKAPVVSNLKYDKETGKLTWTATDEGTGIETFLIFVNYDFKNPIVPEPIEVTGNNYEYNMKDVMDEILKVEGDNKIDVFAVDYAWNEGYDEINVSNDVNIPYIYLLQPDLLEIYTENDIEVQGYVLKNNEITSVKVDGNEAEVVFDEEIKHLEGTPDEVIVPGYRFSYTLTDLADGLHTIKVEAESLSGTKADIARRFYVDTTKPEFGQINILPREEYEKEVELEILMSDNMQAFTLYVYDSVEFDYDGAETSGTYANPSQQTATVTVDLDLGINVIPLKLVDAAGNETTTTVDVTRIEITDEQSVMEDTTSLDIKYATGDSSTSVTKNLTLPAKGEYGSVITWASSDKDVVAADGKVTIPAFDTVVTLTATITKGTVEDTKVFTVTVKGDPEPILGVIEAKYGKLPVEEGNGYIAYISFNLKEVFNDRILEVSVDGVALEGKEDLEDEFRYTFSGYIDSAPVKVVISIDGTKFDITKQLDFIEITNTREFINLINSISNKTIDGKFEK